MRSPPDKTEVRFAVKARVGQKNGITRQWAKRGTQPSAPQDRRTTSTWIFGAICPKDGKGAGLIEPNCNTQVMNLHLAGIAGRVAPAWHALRLPGQAGWQVSHPLIVPENVPMPLLSAKCPDLDPVGSNWQFRRDNRLSNRIVTDRREIVAHGCYARHRLSASPWRITATEMRDGAHEE